MNDPILLPNGFRYRLDGNVGYGVSVSLTIPVGHSNARLGLAALFEQVLLRQFKLVQVEPGGTITSFYGGADDAKMYPALLRHFLKMVNFRNFDQDTINAVVEDIALHTRDLAPLPARQMNLLYRFVAFDDEEKRRWDPEGYIETLKSYTVKDLQEYADTYMTGNNIILTVTGCFLNDESEADDVRELVRDWFSDIAPGEVQPIINKVYSGGYERIEPSENYRQFMLGWNISDLHNVAEANVMMMTLKMRIERSFASMDANSVVKISNYYGFRTLCISVSSHGEKDVNKLIDIVCANVKRLRTELASARRMETSRQHAMSEKMGVFQEPLARAVEIAWQLLGRGEMYDINERLNVTWHVDAHDVREIAQEIFSGVLTYVVYAPDDVYSYDEVKAKL